MTDLSQDQVEKRASIEKTAMIWGVVVGVIAGLLALWVLSGQGGAVRWGGAVVIGGVAGFFVRRASFNSGAKSAKCGQCGAAFSRSRTDRQEALAGSEAKEEREDQADGSVKVTTWTEETYDVTDTYTCAKCGDAEVKTYQTTRRKDETSVVEPAAAPDPVETSGKSAAAGSKAGKSAKGSAASDSSRGRSGKSRKA